MNNFWSNYVQGTKALDYDRRRRIREEQKDLYLQYLGLKKNSIIVDIGSGPGNFSRQFAKWLDFSSKIIGIERDTNFIKYAEERAAIEGIKTVQYIEGDALALPIEDNSVDACYSSAVIQYVDPEKFILEQKRICKSGGTVAVMNIISPASFGSYEGPQPEKSQREKYLWDILMKDGAEKLKEWDLLKHEMKLHEYPALFEKLGFKDIEVNALNIYYAVDDARNSIEKKLEIIEADRQNDLEVVELGINCLETELADELIEELRQLIEERYKERRRKAINNEPLWDFRISTLLIVKGTKRD